MGVDVGRRKALDRRGIQSPRPHEATTYGPLCPQRPWTDNRSGVKSNGKINGVGWVSPLRCCDATSALLLEAADEVFLVLVDKGRDSNNEPGADTKLQ